MKRLAWLGLLVAATLSAQENPFIISKSNLFTSKNPTPVSVTLGLPASPTLGDMVYFNGTAWASVPIGANGEVLTLVAGVPDWSASAAGGYATFQDEGGALTQFTVVNCVGAGIVCSNGASKTTITVAGAAGAVNLQGSYPGTPDTGNANITGTYGSTQNNIHATISNFGLSLENNQAALVGQTREYSPGIRFVSSAWDTDGAVADTNSWQVFGRPLNGNTTSVDLVFYASLAGGAYTQKAALDSNGLLTLGEASVSAGGVKLLNATSGSITIAPVAGALGTVTLTAPAVTGTILQTGTDVTLAQVVPASAASRVLGRGSAGGAGDFEELAVGNGVEISTTTIQTTVSARTQKHVLIPETAAFMSTAGTFPQLVTTTGTNFPVSSLKFDATTATDEAAYWKVPMNHYASGNVTAWIYWYADTATTGNVVWGCALAAITPITDSTDVETKAFGTATLIQTNHLGTTAQRVQVSQCTITNLDSVAEDDVVFIKIFRDSDSSGGQTDDMAGDAQLIMVKLNYLGAY